MRCKKCGRDVEYDDNDEYIHVDGRVKHRIDEVEEEDGMAPRTRTKTPDGKTYTAVLDPEDPEDASLVAAAQEIFEDLTEDESEAAMEAMGIPPEEPMMEEAIASVELDQEGGAATMKPSQIRQTHPVTDDEDMAPQGPADNRINPNFGKPKREDMVTVRGGGQYLTARRRIVWMRGEIVPHPDWTIDTYTEEIERGKYINKSSVEGGYARYRANVFDETGRLIGTGTKTEFSERFMDFAEKAETGAIARALAVCGYGTEAALDLDEGIDDDRVADAPVEDKRPITIGPSNVSGLRQGGRSENITQAQLNEIQRLIGQAAMGMTLVPFMEGVLESTVPELGDDPTATILAFIKQLTFKEAGLLIQALNKAISDGT